MNVQEIAKLNESIQQSGQSWEAGENPMSALQDEELAQYLGLAVSEDELAATTDAIKSAEQFQLARAAVPGWEIAAPPAAVDWRANSGNWVTPVKDQKSCGSCVAFGTVATIESRYRIACRQPGLAIDLSESQLFFCGCGRCCSRGWNFVPALEFAKKTGIAKESSAPYTPTDKPCPSAPIELKIDGYSAVLAVADRKAALASKGPMVGGMAVYSDFTAYRGGVYRKTADATLRGYHCICVIGYDDKASCWICKNSWGDKWGDKGFFRIGYGECGLDSQFAFYDVTVTCKTNCESYRPALAKLIVAARTNARLRLCLRQACTAAPVPVRICSPAQLAVVRQLRAIFLRCPQLKTWFCRSI